MISSISSGGSYGSASMSCGMRPGKNAPSQIAEDMFQKTDNNGDGVLDKSEISSFLKALSSQGRELPNADDLFSNLDANGDGQISKDENRDGIQSLMREHAHKVRVGQNPMFQRPDSDALFDEVDANGDGSIDKSELTSALASRRPIGSQGPNVDDLFKKLDVDGDGKISKEEHRDGLRKLHDERHESAAVNTTNSTDSNALMASFLSTVIQQYKANIQDSSPAGTLSVLA